MKFRLALAVWKNTSRPILNKIESRFATGEFSTDRDQISYLGSVDTNKTVYKNVLGTVNFQKISKNPNLYPL